MNGSRVAGSDLGLQATYRWSWPTANHPDEQGLYNGANTYAVLVHAALVEVDPETGQVKVLKYVATEDCGRLLNPMIVRGQTMGGVVNGLGWALTEQFVYDDQGQLLTGTFMEYAIPRADDMPELVVDRTVTPSPLNPLGVKGVGEGSACVAPPANVNAVVDALSPFGVHHVDIPLTSEKIWRAIHGA